MHIRAYVVISFEIFVKPPSTWYDFCPDLIAAYKSIVKEKDALEATVKALSAPQVTPLRREKLQKQANKDGKEENPESDFIDPLREVWDILSLLVSKFILVYLNTCIRNVMIGSTISSAA